MKFDKETKDIEDIKAHILGYMPEFRIKKFEARLESDKDLMLKKDFFGPFMVLDNKEFEAKENLAKIREWHKNRVSEYDEKPVGITDFGVEDNVKPLPVTPWYQRPVFRYAAGLLLFGALGIGYWTNQAPQRAANDVLELSEYRGDETGCNAHFENVLKDYNTNNDATKAIQSLKSKADPDTKCIALSKFYEAALLMKSKKYDEAKILLNQVITEAEDGSALENKAQKLLDTL